MVGDWLWWIPICAQHVLKIDLSTNWGHPLFLSCQQTLYKIKYCVCMLALDHGPVVHVHENIRATARVELVQTWKFR